MVYVPLLGFPSDGRGCFVRGSHQLYKPGGPGDVGADGGRRQPAVCAGRELPPPLSHQPQRLPPGGQFGMYLFRDWSLITGRGGATKWENRRSETVCAPPSTSREGKTFCAHPPLKSGNFLRPAPPFNMAKTSKLPRKNDPKTFCPPLLQHG